MCIHVYAARTGAAVPFALSLLPPCLPLLHHSLLRPASVRPLSPCVMRLSLSLLPCTSFLCRVRLFLHISLLIYLWQYVFVRWPCARLSPSIGASISAGETYLRFLASTSPLCAAAFLPVHASLPPLCVHESLPSFRASVPSLLNRALPIPSLVLYCLSRSSLPPSSSPAMHPVLFFIPCV